MRLLFRSRLVVLDTETTGIFGRDPWAEVIELGAVCLDVDGFEIGAFSRLVKPAVLDSRADGALAVNKIHPADLHRQPGSDVVAAHFGIEAVGEPHRALTDARTAAGVLCAVRRWELERLDSPDGFSGVA